MANPALVAGQSTSTSGGNAANITLIYPNPVTPGNMLIMFGHCGGQNPVSFTISDDVNGTWTKDVTSLGGNVPGLIATFPNTAAGTPTVTFATGASVSHHIGIAEVANVRTASPFDQGTSASGSGTGNPSSGNITTTNAIDIVFGFIGNSFGNTYTAGSGFTADINPISGTKGATEYQILTNTATLPATFTQTNNQTWQVYVASYKGLVVSGAIVAWIV